MHQRLRFWVTTLLLLTLSAIAQATPPVNDEPSNATQLSLSTTCMPVRGTTVDATPSPETMPTVNQILGWNKQADVFYTFIAPCSRLNLTIQDVESAVQKSVGNISLYHFSAGNYVMELNNFAPTTLVPGDRYYVRVQTKIPASFTLCATIPYTTFAPVIVYPHQTGYSINGMHVGDITGDNYPDLLLLREGQSSSLLANQRNGTFAIRDLSLNNNAHYLGAALGDMDNDGRIDIVYAQEAWDTFRNGYYQTNYREDIFKVYYNRSQQLYWLDQSNRAITDSTGYGHTMDIALGDVNKDGFLDVIISNSRTRSVNVHLSKKNGTFAPFVAYANPNSHPHYRDIYVPNKITMHDMNGDGFIDILTTYNGRGGKIGLLLNRGDGTFAPVKHIGVDDNSWYNSVAVGDVNGDSAPDLVVTDPYADKVVVFLNEGNSNFGPGKNIPKIKGLGQVVLADVSGDGALDIVLSTDGAQIIWLHNNKDGTFGNSIGDFSPQETYYTTNTLPRTSMISASIVALDLNLDGRIDIAAFNSGEREVSILLNQGPCAASVTSTTPAQRFKSLSIAPNPAQQSATILLPETSNVTRGVLTLQDGLGRSVRTQPIQGSQPTLDLMGVSPGVYFVHVQVGEEIYKGRLLVN